MMPTTQNEEGREADMLTTLATSRDWARTSENRVSSGRKSSQLSLIDDVDVEAAA